MAKIMSTIHVNLGPRSYNIQIGYHVERQFISWLSILSSSRSALLVFDQNVMMHAVALGVELEKASYRKDFFELEPGEGLKSLATLKRVYDELAKFQADRQTLVIAIGGGVIGDLVGFAAATFNRGLPLIMIPTTLLAMVDSSVGGKVGINHAAGKNLIGSFHQPRGVWIDTHYLDSLPQPEYLSGLAEVVKYGMILDASFFGWLEYHREEIVLRKIEALEHLIKRSCELKAQVVEEDEYETRGQRAVLNFGHTFGHAFEKVAGYGTLLHGQAVALGMVCACRLGEKLGRIGSEVTGRLINLLKHFDLPVSIVPTWLVDEMIQAMRHDKKNVAGQLRFVLPMKIGQVESNVVVEEEVVRQVLLQKD
jgi:3-dehydroquinate synthase